MAIPRRFFTESLNGQLEPLVEDLIVDFEKEYDYDPTDPTFQKWYENPDPDVRRREKKEATALLSQGITLYGVSLLYLERAGSTIFSQTKVAYACHRKVFASYPLKLFSDLDTSWNAVLRDMLGPGIGVTVPPLLAVVLSRARRRNEISSVIRDLREEYANSRRSLWEHLEEMWLAPTLKKQIQLSQKLVKASANLFAASFPERCRFLETALSVAIDAAEMKPLSMVGDAGKAILNWDKTALTGISFARQLSSDLRRVGGLHRLLPKILTQAEKYNFALL